MAWYCSKGDHYPQEVIADIPREFDPDRIGIFIDGKSGMSTNRWADGTAGVQLEFKDLAEDDEEPICPEHHDICEWKI